MEKKKLLIGFLDYVSVAFLLFIFILAWFNLNLTDMPWYGTLGTLLLVIFSVFAVFAMLEKRGHRRMSLIFCVLLVLLSVPSAMHISSGSLSFSETILFYARQVYMPLLAGSSLFLLLKRQRLWRMILRWGVRAYAVLGVMLGSIVIYAGVRDLLQESVGVELVPGLTEFLMFLTIVALVLATVGLIANPLYVVWRFTSSD